MALRHSRPHLIAAIVLSVTTCLGAARGATRAGRDKDLATVKKRIYESLLPVAGVKKTVALAQTRMKSLRPDGTWQDIDYKNRAPASWMTVRHLSHLVAMARAFRQPNGALTGSAKLKAAILRGLDHWLAKDYRNPNWWWNEIGVPMNLGKVLVLMEKDLNRKQLASGIRIMKRSRPGSSVSLSCSNPLRTSERF